MFLIYTKHRDTSDDHLAMHPALLGAQELHRKVMNHVYPWSLDIHV